jgi:hypothetical protein
MIDLKGQRFGRLVVLRYSAASVWFCRCDCGTELFVGSQNLRRTIAPTRSCGCAKLERLAEARKIAQQVSTRHGHATRLKGKSGAYNSWDAMIQRCTNPKTKGYRWYGRRGIKVCERWLTFDNFLADMGERPEGDYSIERLDNDGDYEPGNCKWAPRAQQSATQRRRT